MEASGLKYTLPQIDSFIRNPDNQTVYEYLHGIKPINVTLVHNTENLRFYVLDKSDGQKGLKIAFRVGRDSSYWLLWDFSDDQARDMINLFPKFFEEIKKHNAKFSRECCNAEKAKGHVLEFEFVE